MKFKYIVVEHEGKQTPIVFPLNLIHKHVARIHRVGEVILISAGFCECITTNGKIKLCQLPDKSETLPDFPPRKEDATLLHEFFVKE